MIDWRGRVVSDPEIRAGEACIGGTRIPVSVILACLASGDDEPAILREYPSLAPADIRAALSYAADVLHHER
jgi:uncharacterized protein (DUF433 family)